MAPFLSCASWHVHIWCLRTWKGMFQSLWIFRGKYHCQRQGVGRLLQEGGLGTQPQLAPCLHERYHGLRCFTLLVASQGTPKKEEKIIVTAYSTSISNCFTLSNLLIVKLYRRSVQSSSRTIAVGVKPSTFVFTMVVVLFSHSYESHSVRVHEVSFTERSVESVNDRIPTIMQPLSLYSFSINNRYCNYS